MNTKSILDSVYEDFFGVESILKEDEEFKQEKDVDMKNVFLDIDKLLIDDESKELLKKIIEYMRKYKEEIEKTYIPFRVVIKSKDRKTCESIEKILTHASTSYSYVNNSKVNEYDFLHINEKEGIKSDSGIVVYKELSGFNYFDEQTKKKLESDIESTLFEKNNLVIVIGSNDDVKEFFSKNQKLESSFNFVINYKNPDVQDIYQELINSIELNEEDQIKLLDYISKTIESVTNFESYKDNLVKELTFNKIVPQAKEDKPIEEIFKELNDLVGLEKVKKVLNDLVDVNTFKEKTDGEINLSNVNLHMVFLGNPGTGKTTVARIIAGILYNLKYIRRNNLIEVSAKDLVAEYVGQTAPKTNAVIERAMGGVLFVDEAYSLAVKGENSYNAEAIATLIQAMENYRNDLVVIFAGYTKEMQDFLNSNSGIVSRIGYTLEFDDYTEDELVEIFKGFVKKAGFEIKEEAILKLRNIIKDNIGKDNFGNARFVRNIFEKSVIEHARNTKNNKKKNILKTITEKDISTEFLIDA